MYTRILAAISIFALTVACQETQTVTAPKQVPGPAAPPAQPVLLAASSNGFSVFPGDYVPPPAVRVMLAGSPLAGFRVTFTFSDGTIVPATTGQDGVASAGNWALDFAKSADSVIATAEGASGSIKFSAVVLHKTIVAIYDLQLAGGKPATGGLYMLFDDGSYVRGYEVNGKPQYSLPNQFFRRDSSIEFDIYQAQAPQSQYYANHGYQFSWGTLSGRTMAVTYTDFIDFDDETYLLR